MSDLPSADRSMANVRQTDVLIIGAGLAGLSTALALPKSLSVTVLSKAALEVCSSHYAQGGIAASLDKEDSITDHVSDTLIAGAGLCTTDNTTDILGAGQSAVQWLCEQGVPFTQTSKQHIQSKNKLQTTDLHLTQEGGHGRRRVAHADDATGRHIMKTLTLKAQSAANITILPFHEALSLLTHDTGLKSCYGAQVFDHISARKITFYSRAVVLASGGLGQLFKRASAPNVCVGDGVMMAWQAGSRLANLEFIQFHPTGLALSDSSFLISEALRGEGAHLYCPQTGKRFMLEIDARAELAPRDIVARAIAEQISNNGLGYVHLDISHLPSKFITGHFPQIYQTLFDLGIDITTDPIPVAPTAHYSCGGVVTDARGMTDVPGLYAAGEVAYTGLHGANRLASNSLLECVVVGRNIAIDLPRYLNQVSASSNSFEHTLWTPPVLTDTQVITLPEGKNTHIDSMVVHRNTSAKDTDINMITNELKTLMSTHMGITRSASKLEQALVQIAKWQQILKSLPVNQSEVNTDSAMTTSELAHFQLSRQLQLATLVIESAHQRYESRGGHYRSDYPHLALKAKTSVIAALTKTTKSQSSESTALYDSDKQTFVLAAS